MNDKEPKKISAGQLVYLSSGSYSDYSVGAHARALQDFTLPDVEARYNAFRLQDGGELAFMPWAVSQGLLEEVENVEEIWEDYEYDYPAHRVKKYTIS